MSTTVDGFSFGQVLFLAQTLAPAPAGECPRHHPLSLEARLAASAMATPCLSRVLDRPHLVCHHLLDSRLRQPQLFVPLSIPSWRPAPRHSHRDRFVHVQDLHNVH